MLPPLASVASDMLPSALGIAVSPLAIALVILMLLSEHALRNALAFTAAWFAACFAGVAILAAVLDGGHHGGRLPRGEAWLFTGLGALLVLLGIAALVVRGDHLPRVLARAEKLAPRHAAMTGFAGALASPKELPLIIAGAAALARAPGLAAPGILAGALGFALVASAGLLVPIALYAARREHAARLLAAGRDWLLAHHAVVSGVLLIVVGVVIGREGVRAL